MAAPPPPPPTPVSRCLCMFICLSLLSAPPPPPPAPVLAHPPRLVAYARTQDSKSHVQQLEGRVTVNNPIKTKPLVVRPQRADSGPSIAVLRAPPPTPVSRSPFCVSPLVEGKASGQEKGAAIKGARSSLR